MLTFGDPRVSTAALCDLSRLLSEHGLRRPSADDRYVITEASHEERITADHLSQTPTPADHGLGRGAGEGAQCSGTERSDREPGSAADGSGRCRVRGGSR